MICLQAITAVTVPRNYHQRDLTAFANEEEPPCYATAALLTLEDSGVALTRNSVSATPVHSKLDVLFVLLMNIRRFSVY